MYTYRTDEGTCESKQGVLAYAICPGSGNPWISSGRLLYLTTLRRGINKLCCELTTMRLGTCLATG
jgi:hypothetical protein